MGLFLLPIIIFQVWAIIAITKSLWNGEDD